MRKKGEILVENIVFLVLNLVFLTILLIFLLKQGSGAMILEDSYSKEIALLIDSARPRMVIHVNFEDAKEVSDKNGILFSEVLKIEDNYVKVKLSEKGGEEYHFFNDINVTVLAEKNNEMEFNGFYIFTFSSKK